MESFMFQSFHISKILLALLVTSRNARPKHNDRPSYGLVYQCTGNVTYTFSTGKVLTVQPGEIIFLPKGSSYENNGYELCNERLCIAINFLTVEALHAEPFIIHPLSTAHIRQQFSDCERLWKTAKSGKYEKCLSLLYEILYDLKKDYFKSYMPAEKVHKIQPAIQYIEENYMLGTISIAYLSTLCGISVVHFRNIFRALYDVSPNKYIQNLRIARAKELLQSGECTVTAVSELCGYGSDCVFSREFKQATGITPSEYKRKF